MKLLLTLLLFPFALCAMATDKAVEDPFPTLVMIPVILWAAPTLLSLIVVLPLTIAGIEDIAKTVILWGTAIGAAGPIAFYLAIVIGFITEAVFDLMQSLVKASES